MILLDNSTNNTTLVVDEDESSQTIINNNNDETKMDQTIVVDHSTNIKSVKEHAKKLNRLNTESELKHLNLNVNDMSVKSNRSIDSLNDSSSSARFKVLVAVFKFNRVP